MNSRVLIHASVPADLKSAVFGVRPLFLLLLFLFASCTMEDDRPGPFNGGVAISPDVATIGSEPSATRAATAEALAEGSTVRIVAYTDASMSVASYSGEGCYVMKDGALKPCTTDDGGKLLSTGGTTDGLWLRGGASYHFFAVTPAVAVDATQAPPVTKVKNLADFASSLTQGVTVAKGATSAGVTLNTLQRRCAHVSFAFDRVWTNVTRTEIESVKLTRMTDEPQQAAGTGDLPADAAHATEVTFGKSCFTTNATDTWLASGGAAVLPKASDGLDLTLSVRFNGSATPTELKATGISPIIFAKGLGYTFRVKLRDGVVLLTLEVEKWTNHDSNGSAGTPPSGIVIGSWSDIVWDGDSGDGSHGVLPPGWEDHPSGGETGKGPVPIRITGWKAVTWNGSVGGTVTMESPDWTNNETAGVVGGETANCYIVTQPGTYAFDATVRGNGAEGVPGINYSTLPDLRTATEARVIWQTGSSATGRTIDPASVKLQDGIVSYTTGADTEGNAVIGIFASSDPAAPCLWSWHIWRLNGSAPGTATGTKTSATTGADEDVVMMDRNLGAYNNTPGDVGAIGLLYQWGRKDPFPGLGEYSKTERSDIYGSYNNNGTVNTWSGDYSIQTVDSSTGGTEVWAVKYPTIFITSSGDWMSTKNDNLWGTPWSGTGDYNKNQGTKSIYDPCPIGYRVPPQDTWSKQTGMGSLDNMGMILDSFNVDLWFPSAGLRSNLNGSLMAMASMGNYWSSSPFDAVNNGASRMTFNSRTLSPKDGFARATGISVRCVSEK